MATGSTRDVKMVLSVESLGQENITKLQQALRDLATTGGQGTAEFADLADQIDRLGDQGAALQSFRTLSAETDALRDKQIATGESSKALADRLGEASRAADAARLAQASARQALVEGDKANTAAGNALRELRAEYDAAGKQTTEYRTELLRLVKVQSDAGLSLVELRDQNRQATAAVTEAAAAQRTADKAYTSAAKQAELAGDAVRAQAIALKQAGDAARELGVDTENLSQAEAELLSVFSRGVSAVDARKQAVLEMAEADRLAGIEAKALAALYQRGEAALQAETQAQRDAEKAVRGYLSAREQVASDGDTWQREADAVVSLKLAQQAASAATLRTVEQLQELAQVNAFQKQAAEAQKLVQAAQYVRFWEDALRDADREQEALLDSTRRVNAAFTQLDVRSLDDVQAEIAQTNQAMRTLAEQGRLTGGALAVAMERGTQKINELQRETRELTGTLTTADRAASLFKNSIGQISAGNLIADAIGYLVEKVKELGREFVEVVLQTESTRKALNAIYKDAGVTAAQMIFLRNTANAAGVSFSGITEDFVRFSAAAKGSNIPIEQSNALFQSLTRAASSLGLGAEKTGLALNALGQIASKGVVSMEELRQQLGDSVPGALSLTAKGLGITEAELIKLVESGQLAARDFFPAFTEGLKTLQGETDGVRQTWERFKNVLALSAVAAESNGGLVLLAGTLKVLGGFVGAVVLGFSTLQEALFAVGRAALLFYGILKGDGEAAFAFFNDESAKMVARLTEQADAFNALLDPSKENLDRLSASAAANATLAGATAATTASLLVNTKELAANAAQAQTTAAGANALAAANRITKDVVGVVTEKWVSLSTTLGELASQQAANVVVSEKLAKAVQLEGQAAVSLAKLRGDEAATLQAAADAATRNADALAKVAIAREGEAAVLAVLADQLAKEAILQDGSTEKRAAGIKVITDKIEKLNAEALAARNAAEGARIATAEQELAIEMYKDNSAAVESLAKAREDASVGLELQISLEKLGLSTKADVAAAEVDLAKATRLYKDALGDTTKALSLRTRAAQADLALANAKSSVEQSQLERLAKEATARGDTTRATYLTIEAKKQEIKQIELAIRIKGLELDADRQSIEIQRASLDVADPLYQQKAAELDIRLKLIEVQNIENTAKQNGIAALQAEIDLLRVYGTEKGNATSATTADTSATDANTAARLKNVQAITAQNAAQAAGKYSSPLGADKYSAPTGGSTTGNTREERLSGQAATDESLRFELLAKLRAGTLTQADLPGLKAVVATLNANQATFDTLPVGLTSFEGMADDRMWAGARTGFEQAISQFGGGANGGTTVTVNLGGNKHRINTASQSDSNALTAMLRDLETQSNTAS